MKKNKKSNKIVVAVVAILFVEKWLLVNLAQREEQFFYLYLTGSAQRESVYENFHG